MRRAKVQRKVRAVKFAQKQAQLKSKQFNVQWINDHESSRCLICDDLFTVLNRKHHCRICGDLVCDSCSKQRTEVLGQFRATTFDIIVFSLTFILL
jgi:hypothetical protein